MKLTKYPNLLLKYSTKNNGNMASLKERKIFLESLGLDLNNIVVMSLEHDANSETATISDLGKSFKCDTLITNQPNVYLFLMTADCIPISLFDKEKNVISLIHGGRKNLNKIIKKTIDKMKKEFKTLPHKLVAEFGPSIGPCCYNLDIWSLAKNQFLSAGVLEKNIYNPKICTYHTNDYFSHRKLIDEKGKDDFIRFATIFGITRR